MHVTPCSWGSLQAGEKKPADLGVTDVAHLCRQVSSDQQEVKQRLWSVLFELLQPFHSFAASFITIIPLLSESFATKDKRKFEILDIEFVQNVMLLHMSNIIVYVCSNCRRKEARNCQLITKKKLLHIEL